MSIFQQMKSDLQESRKMLITEKTEDRMVKVSILRLVVSEFDAKGNTVPDQSDEVVFKKIREYIESNKLVKEKNVVGSDKYIKADMENAILESYLPKQMSEDSIRNEIQNVVTEYGIADMKGMQIIKKVFEENFENQYDKKELGKIAKEIINKGK